AAPWRTSRARSSGTGRTSVVVSATGPCAPRSRPGPSGPSRPPRPVPTTSRSASGSPSSASTRPRPRASSTATPPPGASPASSPGCGGPWRPPSPPDLVLRALPAALLSCAGPDGPAPSRRGGARPSDVGGSAGELGQSGDQHLHDQLARPGLAAPQVDVGGREQVQGPHDAGVAKLPGLGQQPAGGLGVHAEQLRGVPLAGHGSAVQQQEAGEVGVERGQDRQGVAPAPGHHAPEHL